MGQMNWGGGGVCLYFCLTSRLRKSGVSPSVCMWKEIHICDAAKGIPSPSPPELHEVLTAFRVYCRKEDLLSWRQPRSPSLACWTSQKDTFMRCELENGNNISLGS